MGSVPGTVKLLKAGFVVLDGKTGAMTKVLEFQYNPETLVRRITPPSATSGVAGTGGVSALAGAGGLASVGGLVSSAETATAEGGQPVSIANPSPPEFVSFTISLDAADKLNAGDAVTQQDGLLPTISSLELLLYSPNSLIVWVSGSHRVVPVAMLEMVITEQNFDPLLNPIRAEIAVQLRVLKDADLPANSKGRALWDAHYAALQQLGNLLPVQPLSAMGINGV